MQNIINEQKLNPNLYEIIKRYPFNGKSNYLIDKFYIIGYDFPTLHYLLIENNVKDYIKEEKNFVVSEFNDLLGSDNINKTNEKKSFFLPKDPPSILSEISSDYKKILPNFDNIKDIIFPNGCQFYYTNEDVAEDNSSKNLIDKSVVQRDSASTFEMIDNPKNKTKIPNSYNMVFSYNQQGEQNSKKSTNGFAYVFYKKFKEGKISKDNKKYFFFVPFTFCVLSEYPFYNSYYNLCKQLQNLFKSQNNDIPIEMILYNIVNYTPSPLNSDVYINLESFNNNGNVLNELENIKEEDENENEKEEIIFDKNNKNKHEENINNFHSSQRIKSIANINHDLKRRKSENVLSISNSKKGRNFSDLDTASVSSSKSNKKKIKQFKPIKFGFLSGYPIIQYNLTKVLLNKMSPEDVITIFFYTFLEKSVIFFSKDIELLSLTINSYLNLNFPLNDEKYYFYNVSISFENYIEGNSLFIGTTFTNAIGINSKYNKNYKNMHVRLSEHLTVDLDKGVINRVENDRDNEVDEKDELLFNFFEQIYNKKELNENKKSSILYREVKNIFEKLCSYKEKINKKNQEIKDKSKKKINFNYIEYDDNEEKNKENLIRDANRDIQESFYILVNHLCLYFYKNLNLVLPDDNPQKKNSKGKDLSKVVFNDNYNDNNYLQEEIFFLDELRDTMKFQSFVYEFIQNYSPIDLYKIPLTFTEEFLSMLISKTNIYYQNKTKIGFLKLIDNVYENNNKKKERILMDFKQFINEYYQKYKNYFIRELKDEKEKINSFGPELNHNLIFKYKHFIDNLDQNNNCFYSYQNIINENKIQSLQKNAIEDSIESYLMDTEILTSNDICFSNIIILYMITMKNIVMNFDCSICLSSLFYHCKVFRKYYSMIIEIIYKLMKNCLKNQNYKMAEIYLKTYYPFINSLRQNRLIPNENLINIIKKFYELSIDDFRKEDSNLNKIQISEKKDTSKGSENNVIDFNEKFIYIFNNFNKTSVFKEKKILEIMNSDNNYNYNFQEKLRINPKIKFHNGKEKSVFKLHSQKDIFISLNNIYIIYITSNLDDKFLNPLNIFECCLNIMIYFRNMDDFVGKDDIKTMLIQIYDLFLNMKNNKKDIIY